MLDYFYWTESWMVLTRSSSRSGCKWEYLLRTIYPISMALNSSRSLRQFLMGVEMFERIWLMAEVCSWVWVLSHLEVESAIFDFAVPLHIFFVRMHSQTVKGFTKFLPVLALNLAIVLLTRAFDGVCSYLHLFVVFHHFLHPEVHIFLLHLQFFQPQPQQINHFVLVNQRSKQTESLLPKHHQLPLH